MDCCFDSYAPPCLTRMHPPRSQDAELFQVRLARDQAESQAARLKARLEELFGQSGADLTSGAAAGGGRRAGAAAASGSSAVMSAREAELTSTVANLKTALEKATASSVPTTKYMAVSAIHRLNMLLSLPPTYPVLIYPT